MKLRRKKRDRKKRPTPRTPAEKRRLVLSVLGKALMVVLVAALAAANVALYVLGDTAMSYLGGDHVDISSQNYDAAMEDGQKLAKSIEGEGIVLLKNDDDALPISSDTTKVNVFGWASTQWVSAGSGSGQVAGDTEDLLEALTAAGVEYNTQLTDMYKSFHGTRDYTSALNSHDLDYCRLYEPDINDSTYYTSDLLQNAKNYSDTAIVVISRTAGESIDCTSMQYKITESGGSVSIDATRSYLSISREEENLLRYVGQNYEHVIVLVNSTNTMELGQLETIDGIDAAMLVGCTGEVGAESVVDALWGRVNPSGRTTDTYAYSFESAASYANSGSRGEGEYTGSAGLYPADGTLNSNVGTIETYNSVRFVDYVEGIYVGYRWYETADAEGYWDDVSNEHGSGYEGVVQYPFGYGLSYTSFSWEVVSWSPGDNEDINRDSKVSCTVRVTNTGDVAGRDVVELYCTPPYYSGSIEKSSKVLVAYEKTKLLAPGESQDLTLTFSVDDLASYDCYDADGDNFAGYELERGDYVMSLSSDAHTVASCENATVTYTIQSTIDCGTDYVTGADVSNHFTGNSAWDGVSIDGSNSGANITYLTRADFKGTFPSTTDPDRRMTDNVASLNLYDEDQLDRDNQLMAKAMGLQSSLDATDELTSPSRRTRVQLTGLTSVSQDGELTSLGMKLGLDYDDSHWDDLLDSLTVEEMESIVLHGYLGTSSLDSAGKQRLRDLDGPSQVGSFNQLTTGVGYPNGTVLAQTWNKSLARAYGRQLGYEAACMGVDGIYAPSVNIHRSPLGGRNYEYYSEDPLISGETGAAVVQGCMDAGTYCYIKHMAVNNQDSYRDSLYTWLTEQSLREIYLRAFRICVRDNGATGIMTAYNRVGATWSGGNLGLLQYVLRDEWGFQGCVITDYADHHEYMNADQQLAAGGDLYMDGIFNNGSLKYGYSQDEIDDLLYSSSSTKSSASGDTEAAKKRQRAASQVLSLRRATKDVLYIWLNARATNIVRNEEIEQLTPTVGSDDESTTYTTIERPIKSEGFNFIGTGLAIADAVVAVKIVLDVKKRRSTRRKAKNETGAAAVVPKQ
ncbi:MAG: glycoside hydrolase family 3 N-terminal domain-containing protein [Tractidigestivibacter sp.]|uniref:glycoside hydrolase family 3 N-terminal domain-containing protein n=1 Tax=Tractidigestivibacter sp. TaxID=2847320 RepID=UPI003D918B0F